MVRNVHPELSASSLHVSSASAHGAIPRRRGVCTSRTMSLRSRSSSARDALSASSSLSRGAKPARPPTEPADRLSTSSRTPPRGRQVRKRVRGGSKARLDRWPIFRASSTTWADATARLTQCRSARGHPPASAWSQDERDAYIKGFHAGRVATALSRTRASPKKRFGH
jgi:hypothetical protein